VTGWAQVNGGTLVTNDEKGALDEWYVRHASPWLDLRILALTIRFAFTGAWICLLGYGFVRLVELLIVD